MADHRLEPEEGGDALPARDRGDAVEARRGIDHRVPGGQLDALDAIMILDQQFAAVIMFGRFEKDGDRQVAADAEIAAALEADRIAIGRASCRERVCQYV